jgi:cell division septum initiation protein DivIVA
MSYDEFTAHLVRENSDLKKESADLKAELKEYRSIAEMMGAPGSSAQGIKRLYLQLLTEV